MPGFMGVGENMVTTFATPFRPTVLEQHLDKPFAIHGGYCNH